MKTPKFNKQVNVSKEPRAVESPSSYKNINISWQISKIDHDGEWGLNNIKEFEFTLTEELLQLRNAHNDLTNALFELNGKTFKTINIFLDKLHQKCNSNITASQQKVVLIGLTQKVFWENIYPKLKNLESNSWDEIEKYTHGKQNKTNSHFISTDKISKEAQRRLTELRLNDYEELFSLRLEGKIRIWGIRQFSALQIIWFDLEHTVYPVQ